MVDLSGKYVQQQKALGSDTSIVAPEVVKPNHGGQEFQVDRNPQTADRTFAEEHPIGNFMTNMIPPITSIGAGVLGAPVAVGAAALGSLIPGVGPVAGPLAGVSVESSFLGAGAGVGEVMEEELRNVLYRNKEKRTKKLEAVGQQALNEGIFTAGANMVLGPAGRALGKSKDIYKQMTKDFAEEKAIQEQLVGIGERTTVQKMAEEKTRRQILDFSKEQEVTAQAVKDIESVIQKKASSKYGKDFVEENMDEFSRNFELGLYDMQNKVVSSYGRAVKTAFEKFRGTKGTQFEGKGVYDDIFNAPWQKGKKTVKVGDMEVEPAQAVIDRIGMLFVKIKGTGEDDAIPFILGAPKEKLLTEYLQKLNSGGKLSIRELNDVKMFFQGYSRYVAEGSDSAIKGELKRDSKAVAELLDSQLEKYVPSLKEVNKRYADLYSISDAVEAMAGVFKGDNPQQVMKNLQRQTGAIEGIGSQAMKRGESVFRIVPTKKDILEALKNGDTTIFSLSDGFDQFLRQSKALRLTGDPALTNMADFMDKGVADMMLKATSFKTKQKTLSAMLGEKEAKFIEKELANNKAYQQNLSRLNDIVSGKKLSEDTAETIRQNLADLGIEKSVAKNQLADVNARTSDKSLLAIYIAGSTLSKMLEYGVGANQGAAKLVVTATGLLTLSKWSPRAAFILGEKAAQLKSMIPKLRLSENERKVLDTWIFEAKKQAARYATSTAVGSPADRVTEQYYPTDYNSTQPNANFTAQ